MMNMSAKTAGFSPLTVAQAADRLADLARSGKKLIFICHQNPDGDTVGSAFALKELYKALGGTASVGCCADAPAYLRFLCGDQRSMRIEASALENWDAVCAVDVAAPVQLGALAGALEGRVDMMIDHHASGQAFAPYLTVPEAAAAGEIVYDIYREFVNNGRIKENYEICMRLYAAISSDTGSFRFSNASPKTYITAGLLVEVIDRQVPGCHADIARRLHDSRTLADLRAEKLAIENLKVRCGGKLAYVCITADMMEKNGLREVDTGRIVDVPRSVEGVQVGFTVKQNRIDRKSFRISSRSNGEIDVSTVCAAFGGGGHAKAAGGSVSADSPEEAEEIIAKAFEKAVESWSKGEADE